MAKNATSEKAAEKEESKDSIAVREWLDGIADDGVKVRISKWDDNTGTWALSAIRPKDTLTDEMLMRMQPGRYKICATLANNAIAGIRQMTIGEDPFTGPEPGAIYDPGSNNSFNEKLFLIMQQQNQKQHEMMITLLAGMFQAKSGGLEVKDLLVLLKPPDPIATIAALKELQPKPDPDSDTKFDKMIDRTMKMAEMLGGNGGGGPKSTGEMLIETATKLITARAAMPEPNENPNGTSVSGADIGHASGAEPVRALSQVEEPSIDADVKRVVVRLWKASQIDPPLDPEDMARNILDMSDIDEPGEKTVVESILKSASFEDWTKLGPVIPEPLRPWFEKFYTAVKEESMVVPSEDKKEVTK